MLTGFVATADPFGASSDLKGSPILAAIAGLTFSFLWMREGAVEREIDRNRGGNASRRAAGLFTTATA